MASLRSSRLSWPFSISWVVPLSLLAIGVLLSINMTASAQNSHASVRVKIKQIKVMSTVAEFDLPDEKNQRHTLSSYRGKRIVLFFFCGCAPCHELARLWADLQQRGSMTPASGTSLSEQSPAVVTLVVYSGEAEAGQEFLNSTVLDSKQTVLLLDPMLKVSDKYGVRHCPRVFVIGTSGTLCYTNAEKKGEALSPSAPILISRIHSALEHAALNSSPKNRIKNSLKVPKTTPKEKKDDSQ